MDENFYELVGGHPTFSKLVNNFYELVVQDPTLKPMYPKNDICGAKKRLLMFLEQYWGGPKTYSEERGHPRLRIRHNPYQITIAAKDAWLQHMRTAVDSINLPPMYEKILWDYLERAAHSLINTYPENIHKRTIM